MLAKTYDSIGSSYQNSRPVDQTASHNIVFKVTSQAEHTNRSKTRRGLIAKFRLGVKTCVRGPCRSSAHMDDGRGYGEDKHFGCSGLELVHV